MRWFKRPIYVGCSVSPRGPEQVGQGQRACLSRYRTAQLQWVLSQSNACGEGGEAGTRLNPMQDIETTVRNMLPVCTSYVILPQATMARSRPMIVTIEAGCRTSRRTMSCHAIHKVLVNRRKWMVATINVERRGRYRVGVAGPYFHRCCSLQRAESFVGVRCCSRLR